MQPCYSRHFQQLNIALLCLETIHAKELDA